MQPLLISGSIISPLNLHSYEKLANALIYVDDQGIISAIRSFDSTLPTDAAIQSFLLQHNIPSDSIEILRLRKGEFLIPGFVDTHTHAPQVPNIGSGQQYELLDWLQHVTFPMEARFKDVQFAKDVYRKVVRRFIDAGTTTCCYYGSIHLEATKVLADIIHEFGQRALVGKCNMNRNSPDDYIEPSPEVSVQGTKELVAYVRSLSPPETRLIHPVLTPRFAISCTSELMDSLGSLAASDPHLAIQTHISENEAEIALTKKLFSHISDPELTYAGVYDHYGLLRDNTILAHAVWLEDSEMELIKKRNSGISHCPSSNLNLRSGLAKVALMLEKGIKVGLGTDVSGGFSPSLLRSIQHASIASKIVAMSPGQSLPALSIPTLFYLATLGGAQVCNLEHQIGSLEKGKAFDAIIVSVRNDSSSSPPNPNLWGVDDDEDVGLESRRRKEDADNGDSEAKYQEELDAMLERFLFCGDDRNMRRVYVQGRWVGGAEQKA